MKVSWFSVYARGFSDVAYADVSGARGGGLTYFDGLVADIELATGLEIGRSLAFVCVVFHRAVDACGVKAL